MGGDAREGGRVRNLREPHRRGPHLGAGKSLRRAYWGNTNQDAQAIYAERRCNDTIRMSSGVYDAGGAGDAVADFLRAATDAFGSLRERVPRVTLRAAPPRAVGRWPVARDRRVDRQYVTTADGIDDELARMRSGEAPNYELCRVVSNLFRAEWYDAVRGYGSGGPKDKPDAERDGVGFSPPRGEGAGLRCSIDWARTRSGTLQAAGALQAGRRRDGGAGV